MFCRNCGKALAEGAKFCTACGSPTEPGSVQPQGEGTPAPVPGPDPAPMPAPAPAPAPKKRTGMILAIVLPLAALLAVAGVLVGWLLLGGSEAGEEEKPAASAPAAAPTQGAGEIYAAPRMEQVQIRFVSADVSDYPVVRAYFRVEDGNGQSVQALDSTAFSVEERLQGGAYLARAIQSVSPLGRQGLNIDLVADKSGSMYADMDRTKRVMDQFIGSMDYAKGDRVEILAFDDIVEQMCYYTGDSGLLTRGISNMSAEGDTALYNALHEGVHNAALQGGARCVIAFTDGADNRSGYTPQNVVDYANANQVPIYIVGVGGAGNTDTLRDIAQSTGGQYWYIDDLNGLGEIYTQIYAKQQELYMLEYVSDAAADAYAYRDLNVTVSGGGYMGTTSAGFTPVRSVGNQSHASRYELVKESLSWEEASRRCQEMGGHLVTITSPQEEQQIIALAEAQDVKYLWLGGYTSYDSNQSIYGHWVTGEDFAYSNWTADEPSRMDLDGTPERYLMLWYIRNQWGWNDQRNDPAAVVTSMAKSMGFVCEYES